MIEVRLLTGQRFSVQLPADATVLELKAALAAQHGLGSCRLNLRGSFLDDAAPILSLALRPGEFLVAFETRKKRKGSGAAATAAAGAATAAPQHAAESGQQQQQRQAAQHAVAAVAGEAATPPGSPRLGAGAAEQEQQQVLLTSPGKLDTLLPGYLSRPHPSPAKTRLLAAAPVAPAVLPAAALAGMGASGAGGSSNGKQQVADGEQQAAPAAKRARSLLDLAAERFGGAGNGVPADAPVAVPRLQVANSAGAAKAAAAGALDPASAGHAQAPHLPRPTTAAAAVGAAAAALAAPRSNASPSLAAASASAAQPRAAASRGPMRGAGSKRKQPPSAAAAEAPAAATGAGTLSRASAAGAGSKAGAPAGLLQLSDVELDAAAAGLPLPPLARQLEDGFVVLAQLHAFLTRTHIQASWKNLREAAASMALRQSIALPDCRLMAAVCPELVTVRQHYRIEPRAYGDSWRQQVSSPQKVRAAVAAAAAAEAAAAGSDEPLPNPMHLRTDGAGTVLEAAAAVATTGRGAAGSAAGSSREAGSGSGGDSAAVAAAAAAEAAAEEDTHVVEVVDPGKGFLSRPIPDAFLQQLRQRAAAAAGGTGGAHAAANPEADRWAAADEETEEPTEGSEGAGGGEGAAAGGKQRRPVFRVNQLVRQRWCFRRALVRVMLLLQEQATGLAAPLQQARRRSSAAQQKQQQVQWQPGFDPAAVTASQLQAAGEQLSAPARAAAEAAEREAADADALATARRLAGVTAAPQRAATTGRGGGVAAGQGSAPAAAARQQGAARPPQLMKQYPACTDTTQMGPRQFLEHLQQLPWYQGQVTHIEELPARQAQHAAPTASLAPAVAAALQLRGVAHMFTHQAAAIDELLQGRHAVVATSTASGKSLCYSVPILQALAQDRNACALLMFPTKALAQDQLRALRELIAAAFGSGGEEGLPAVEIYDGDTPMGERGAIRERAQLLITNPDMLHMSVLPVHSQFGRLLSHLKYVVVDEGHAYKGVFGCHTALVLRRLRRLCDRVYHSQPTFAVTTATVANPREHACELLGVRDVTVIGEDGSPHGAKSFVLWNPPLLQSNNGFGGNLTFRLEARRAKQAAERRRRQELNQERGAGYLPGLASNTPSSSASDAERVVAAKLDLRRQQMQAAMGGGGQQQSECCELEQQQQHGQQDALQPPAQNAQQQRQQASGSRAQPAGRAELPPELQQAVADAKAALATVGGSSATASRRSTTIGQGSSQAPAAKSGRLLAARPLIRRQSMGAKAAVQQLAGPASGSGTAAISQRGGGGTGAAGDERAAAGGTSAEQAAADEDYRVRLPDGDSWRQWKAVVAAGSSANGSGGGNGGALAQGGQAVQRAPAGRAAGQVEWKEEEEEAQERRSSPIVELSMLLAECVRHGLRTIAFCKSRKLCELVTAYVREILKSTAPELAGTIAVYRAGYSPAERREIERALFQGKLRAVAATNALELGVDIGSLDCTLHLGFPGSVASLWQQAGRAGRREQESLGIYLGWDGPLDQYFLQHPEQLFGRPVERAMVDPRNPSVMEAHLACAAAEAPLLLDADQQYFGPGLPEAAAALQAAALLGRHPLAPSSRVLHYVGAVGNPASKISLRAIDPERFAIVDESLGGALLEEIEESKAFFEVYDGAVYLYQGRTYLCKKLDLDARVAVVRPADLKYYTKCIDFTDVHVRGGKVAFAPAAAAPPAAGALAAVPAAAGASAAGVTGSSADTSAVIAPVASPEADASLAPGVAPAMCSQALVTVRWLGFRRIWRGTGEVFDTVDLFLPDVQFETEAAYIRLPPSTRQRLADAGLPFREGVHAACHALLNVLPLYLMCNAGDVGTECDSPYDTRYKPERILLYDKHPGGIGLAAAATPLFAQLLRRALALVRECGCSGRTGCPACVQHTECGEYNAALHKRAAAAVLEALVEGEDPDVEDEQQSEQQPSGSEEMEGPAEQE